MGDLFTPEMFDHPTPRRRATDATIVGVDYGVGDSWGCVVRARVSACGVTTITDIGHLDAGRITHDAHRPGGRRHWHPFDPALGVGPPQPLE